jgi:hypothetical protein
MHFPSLDKARKWIFGDAQKQKANPGSLVDLKARAGSAVFELSSAQINEAINAFKRLGEINMRLMADQRRYLIAFTGDGCFMMNPQILIEGAVHGVRGMIVVFDNRRMGAISSLQTAQYDGMSDPGAKKSKRFIESTRSE